MGFGKILGEILKEKGIKQSELADELGMTRSTLNSIITRDTSKVEIETFLAICKAIDVDPEELYQKYERYARGLEDTIRIEIDESTVGKIKDIPVPVRRRVMFSHTQSETERRLLESYRKLSADKQRAMLDMMESITADIPVNDDGRNAHDNSETN